MRRDVIICDLETWLSNFPEGTKLLFNLNGIPIEWVGGTREASFPFKQGDLSPVAEVVTMEFKHGASQVQEQARP